MEKNTVRVSGFIYSGHTAGAFHGLCPQNLHHTEYLSPWELEEGIETQHFSYTPRTYYVEEDVITDEHGTRYTGLNQTVADMIHSGNDVSAVDEAIVILHEDGKLNDFVQFARSKNFPEDELKFALQALEEDYLEVFEEYYPNADSDGITPRLGRGNTRKLKLDHTPWWHNPKFEGYTPEMVLTGGLLTHELAKKKEQAH